jgi:hypothetical protein
MDIFCTVNFQNTGLKIVNVMFEMWIFNKDGPYDLSHTHTHTHTGYQKTTSSSCKGTSWKAPGNLDHQCLLLWLFVFVLSVNYVSSKTNTGFFIFSCCPAPHLSFEIFPLSCSFTWQSWHRMFFYKVCDDDFL